MAAWNTSILLPPPPPLLSRAAVATPALNPYPLRLHRRHPQKPLCLPSESYPADTDADASSASLDSRPRRIALFVEPSPFAYVSGYKNRFLNFIKYLREMGDEVSFSPALDFGIFFPLLHSFTILSWSVSLPQVIVITTHEGVPQEFYGAKLIGSWSFPCPWYQKVPLSLALSPRIIGEVARFKPDIIHASSPGIMVAQNFYYINTLSFNMPLTAFVSPKQVFGALIIAKLLCVPLVMSYHTHVPM
jgi:sulfoquinovosyltransferase